MYIVSTTFVVEPAVHGQWYEIFTNKFAPTLSDRKTVFTRVMHEHSEGNYTYSLQVEAADMTSYQEFVNGDLAEFIDYCATAFLEKVLHFTTLLKKIEL